MNTNKSININRNMIETQEVFMILVGPRAGPVKVEGPRTGLSVEVGGPVVTLFKSLL